MRALVKAEAAPGLVMRDEPTPTIGPDDILIEVKKTGICGTDLHIWNWDAWAQKTIPVPMVVGHEFAGRVVEIGSHVRTVKVGDRVSGEGHLIGMKSRMARAGHAAQERGPSASWPPLSAAMSARGMLSLRISIPIALNSPPVSPMR